MKKSKNIYKKRPKLTIQNIYDAYVYMYCNSFSENPITNFDCIYFCSNIKQKFLNELENICLRELRHLDNYCYTYSHLMQSNSFEEFKDETTHSIDDTNLDKKDLAFLGINVEDFSCFKKKIHTIKKFLKKIYGEEGSRNQNKKCKYNNNLANLDYVNAFCGTNITMLNVSNIFDEWSWESGYAGEGWADIAKMTHMLRYAPPLNFFYVFDRVVDFIHNNGNVLNKMKIEDGFEEALDNKACAKNVLEILPFCSCDARNVYAKAMKDGRFWLHEKLVENTCVLMEKYIKTPVGNINDDTSEIIEVVEKFNALISKNEIKIR